MADVVLEPAARRRRARRPGRGDQLRHRRLARRRPDGPARRGHPDRGGVRRRPGTGPGSTTRPGPTATTWCWRWTRQPATTWPTWAASHPTGACSSATSTPSNRVATYRTRTTVGTPDSRRCWRWSNGPPPPSSPRSRAAAWTSTPMTRQPLVARHAEELLGTAVVATAPVAGGDVCVGDQAAALRRHHRDDEDPHHTRRRTSSPPRPPGCAGWREAGGVRRCRRCSAVDEELPDPALGRAGPGLGRRRRRLRARARGDPRGRRAVVRRRGRRLHRQAAAAQPGRPRPGRSSTPSAGCCPTSSWPATAAPGRRGRRRARSRAWSARLTDLVPEEPPGPAARRPVERQRALGHRAAGSG